MLGQEAPSAAEGARRSRTGAKPWGSSCALFSKCPRGVRKSHTLELEIGDEQIRKIEKVAQVTALNQAAAGQDG